MLKTAHLVVLPSLLLAALAGCANDHPANAPDNPPPPPTSAVNTGAPAGSPDALGSSTTGATAAASAPAPTAAMDAGGAPPADTTAAALTDEQIIQITHTANAGEIEQAKLAQTKAKDARVKQLAAMMLKDHSAADAKGMALAKKASLSPAPSPASSSLESDAQSATSSLKSQAGADFDKGYVDTQVKEHQAVLDTIDQKLLPSAKNADLKAFLTEVRAKVAMHLQHAQDLQKTMQK